MSGMFSRIDTVIVRVKNLKKARQFYEEVLELTPTYAGNEDHPIVVYKVGEETPLTIYQLQPDEVMPAKRFATSYPIFFAEDIIQVHAKLKSRGVDVGNIEDDGMVKFFGFRDTDGNRLEVCHWE